LVSEKEKRKFWKVLLSVSSRT